MEVGQPAAPAPRTAIAAAKAALDKADIGYTAGARHPGAARAHRAALCRDARRHGRAGAHRGDDRLVGRLHPGVSFAVRAGRPRRGRVSRLSALPSHPHRARLRAGADRDFGGDALVDHDRCAARGAPARAAQGRAGRKPGQSDRHDDAARRARRADRGGGRRGHPLHLGRDLPRPRLRVPGRDRGEILRQLP